MTSIAKRVDFRAFVLQFFKNRIDPVFPQSSGKTQVMTMYAQLLSSVSTGECKAGRPLFDWSMSFSWSQRALAEKTISSAEAGTTPSPSPEPKSEPEPHPEDRGPNWNRKLSRNLK